MVIKVLGEPGTAAYIAAVGVIKSMGHAVYAHILLLRFINCPATHKEAERHGVNGAGTRHADLPPIAIATRQGPTANWMVGIYVRVKLSRLITT